MATKKTTAPSKALTSKTIDTTVPTVNETELIKKGQELQTEVSALVITSQEDYNKATLERAKIKQHIELLEGIFAKTKKTINDALNIIKGEEKKLIGPRLSFANGLLLSLNTSMSNWILSEERRVKKEKDEADRLEKDRIAKEQAALLKKADKAEDKGNTAKATALKEQAYNIPQTFSPAPVKQAVSFAGTGTSARDDVDYVVTDTRLFVKFLLDAGVTIDTVIEFKRKGVKDFIKTQEFEDGEIELKKPGVTFTKKKTISG